MNRRIFTLIMLLLPIFASGHQQRDTLELVARANTLDSLSVSLFQNGDCINATIKAESAIRIWESLGDTYAEDCSYSLYNLSVFYYSLGNYIAALEYQKKSQKIRKAQGDSYLYSVSLNFIGVIYHALGSYQESLQFFLEAVQIRKELLGEEHPAYAESLNNVGLAYSSIGDYVKSLQFLFEAMQIRKKKLGEEHLSYAESLNNIGLAYSNLGDYQKSLEYYSKSLEIKKNVLGENSISYAQSLNNIGTIYSVLGDYSKSLEYYLKALSIQKEFLGELHPDYATFLDNVGSNYIKLNDTNNAFVHIWRALQIRKEVLGMNHPDFAKSLDNIGKFHISLGEYQKALNYQFQAMQVRKVSLGQGHPYYYESLNHVGDDYISLHDYQSSSPILAEYYRGTAASVLSSFQYLTGNSRAMFWEKYSIDFMSTLAFRTYTLRDIQTFLYTSYDGMLLSKGLLLNAETEIRDLILESKNEKLLALYDRFSIEKHQLARQLEKPIAERTMPTDSLEAVCDKLESELMKKSKAFGDYTKNLAIKWTDVQAKLGKKDIAIEFMEVPVSADTTKYCALTLKKGYYAPHFVELFDLKDLQALNAKYASRINSDGLIYGDPALYKLVWEPLEAELKGVDNIYFGPSGELYQLAIEYATDGKKTMAEKKKVYRLSSTRQLALIRDKGVLKSSSIYGGFKYGASMETLLADSRNYTATSTRSVDPFFNVDSLNIRGASSSNFGVNDLPGTMEEATTISRMMDKAHFRNSLTVGEAGTEAAFKSISGQKRKILHIATHGFYWTKSEAERIAERLDRREMMMSGNDNRRVKEDAALTRSGLLFSGANNALKKGYQKQDGVEDGILTAKEIAGMDLRGTDLLVLSACQTGLGEVSGEGVFGLQRGFKKAGVNSILMSLWEVDDEATQLLMTTFYRNLTSGKSKTESLKLAQEKVRKTKGFESPYYWAAFILLDGIE